MNKRLLIGLFMGGQLAGAVHAQGGAAQPTSFTYHDFSQINRLRLNGSASAVTTSDGQVLELTPASANQAGSAFTSDPVVLATNAGFSTFFTFRLNQPGGPHPANGLTFILQSAGPASLGNPAGGLGYGGISHSLAVAFETDASGPGQRQRVAVLTNGLLNPLASVGLINDALNDGNIWYTWIDYDGVSSLLEVRLTNEPVRPSAASLAATITLPALLGSTNVSSLTNLLINGDFELEPHWGSGVSYDGWETALIGDAIPGWTIEPGHAVTIHNGPGHYLVISGNYSPNTDGEGYNKHNANFYQDVRSVLDLGYTLRFNWQSWGLLNPPTTNNLKVSVTDTVTGAALFTGLYKYDGTAAHSVHAVRSGFQGTGNPLRLRVEESPESGYNDNTFMVDDFSIIPVRRPLSAHVGFTGGTGAGWNQQAILSWKFASTPTLRMNGQLILTNTSPGFTLTNGVLVRQIRYKVNSVWYTNKYLYPLSFTNRSDSTVSFTSPFASGLVPGMNGEGLESAAISAEYGWPTQSAGLQHRAAIVDPTPFNFQGVVVDLSSRSLGSAFKNLTLESLTSTFPGTDTAGIQTALANVIKGFSTGGSETGASSGEIPSELFGNLVDVLSPILTSRAADLHYDVSGATFSSMFGGLLPVLPNALEPAIAKELGDITAGYLSDATAGTFNGSVKTEWPPGAEGLSALCDSSAEVGDSQVPVSVPEEAQPLFEAVQRILDAFGTPVEEFPDYAFDMVACSQATRIGLMTMSKEVTLAPATSLELLTPRLAGSDFTFNFRAVANQSYSVWSSTNLQGPNWVAFTNVVGAGYQRTISAPAGSSTRVFYRVSSP